jgi:protein involved in polysaccharide export with SLBB domain
MNTLSILFWLKRTPVSRRHWGGRALGTLLLLGLLAGRVGAAPVGSPNLGTNLVPDTSLTNAMANLDDKHKLTIGDQLSYRVVEDSVVSDHDEPATLVVTDSGELEVPLIGRWPAEGKTCKQVAFELKKALEKDYYYQASVVIAVNTLARSSGRVYLVGAVNVPGPQDIPTDEKFTLSKAILRAGGFRDFANSKDVKVTRKGENDGDPVKIFDHINVRDILENSKSGNDMVLLPGDLIYVPERTVRIY